MVNGHWMRLLHFSLFCYLLVGVFRSILCTLAYFYGNGCSYHSVLHLQKGMAKNALDILVRFPKMAYVSNTDLRICPGLCMANVI